ncbi:MAG TPA: WD40 repeat domain-containing protein [Pyrinomonadaceae bacterium]|jgi:WD40 repeat protein|nr:WD40 repeat domain-containing protein [Pyrinomonadaceae bacterium]
MAELPGHESIVNSAVFGVDGRHIVTASDDWTARIYACPVSESIEDLSALARTHIKRGLTPEERNEYLHTPPQGK